VGFRDDEESNSHHQWGGQIGSLPSGKHTKNYGTSPSLMGKSTINGYVQYTYMLVYQRVNKIYPNQRLPSQNPKFGSALMTDIP
jgi:hypothetical protein